ncbi:MAG: molecular chaperone TorD family protein [Bacteroidales bacterium]|nr:molecular chaperone TorD family protein [Bacteroidales bacterium]
MTGNIESMNTPEELLQAYTALFLFLGSSVSMTPGESGLPHLCDRGLLRNLPVSSSNSRFALASRLLRSPCPLKHQCQLAVGDNYRSLLVGGGDATAFPAASNWVNPGMPAETHHRELSGLYHRYGYSRADDCEQAPDHLGIQLLFTNLLIEKYLTEDDYEIRAMIGKDLLSFINNEMLNWLPRWAEAVSDSSSTKCYTGISGLIIGGLEDVRDILKSQKLGL